MIRHYEIGDMVIYKNKKYKVVRPIGYYNDTKKQIIYDYVLFSNADEELISVAEKDIKLAE